MRSTFLLAISLLLGLISSAQTPCESGFAGIYPCSGYDLQSRLTMAQIGGGSGNDIWGWTSSTGREFAIMGRSSGTSFVEITNPAFPVYLGNLPSHTSNSTWRDIKVHNDHAYIVSEASGHGMQVFELSRLLTVTSPPVTFTEDAHYAGFGNAHNIVIDEASGYAYGVGTNTFSGGLHFVNIQNPAVPVAAGGFSEDGYTHDAQVVVYNGPDAAYVGNQICFASNEDTFTIVDVNDKSDPTMLSRTGYAGSSYTHQGWATEDHQYYLMDDELDENNSGHNTRTYIWNIQDLNAPVFMGYFQSSIAAIDHNVYIKGNKAYQSNYSGGLRVLDITGIATASLSEVGYFDCYPANNNTSFNGTWSNYPYFPSGNIVISTFNEGLFVVSESAPSSCPNPNQVALSNLTATSVQINWNETASATLWDLAIIPAGTTFNGQVTVDDHPSTSYTFSNAVSGTNYAIYVRADCDGAVGSDQSGWVGPLNFVTPSDYCSGDLFTDSGGINGTYQDNENETYVLCPTSPGDYVSMEFLLVDIEVNPGGNSVLGGCYDYLSIYNGPSIASPVISASRCGELDGDGGIPFVPANLLSAGDTFVSTDPSGCLTVTFKSDGSVIEQGWEAAITCLPFNVECQAPDNLDVVEIAFGSTNPRVNATWNNAEGTASCEVRGGRISTATAGTANPAFSNILNTQILNQTDGSTVNFNIALYNNPNIPFDLGKTYGYEVRCQCTDGSGFSAWSGIVPESTFIVPAVVPPGQGISNSGLNEAAILTVYPNPIQEGYLYWTIAERSELSQVNVSILDALGRTVITERLNNTQAQNRLELPQGLEQGMYMLSVQAETERYIAMFIVE
jgi:choice-of-anchor B domain-containing protein